MKDAPSVLPRLHAPTLRGEGGARAAQPLPGKRAAAPVLRRTPRLYARVSASDLQAHARGTNTQQSSLQAHACGTNTPQSSLRQRLTHLLVQETLLEQPALRAQAALVVVHWAMEGGRGRWVGGVQPRPHPTAREPGRGYRDHDAQPRSRNGLGCGYPLRKCPAQTYTEMPRVVLLTSSRPSGSIRRHCGDIDVSTPVAGWRGRNSPKCAQARICRTRRQYS